MDDENLPDDVIDFGDEPEANEPAEQSQEADDFIEHDEPDNEQTTTQDDDPEEEWEAGGQKFKVKKSELRAGYMKDADYRQKTAKAAEQMRAAEQLVQRVSQEHQQRANQLDAFAQVLQRELIGSQPDPRLIESDPQEFLRQNAQYNQRAQLIQQAIAERQALAQQQNALQMQRHQQFLASEREKLTQAIPEWRNDKARQEEQKLISESLSKAGYSPEEIGSIADHRAVAIARKAALYDRLIATREKKSPPPLPTPVKPGASGSTKTDSTASRARERLSRNPGDMDALAGLVGAAGW